MVAILDPRLTTKRYGRQILECLPPMTIIRSLSGMSSIDARLSQVHEDPLFAPPAHPISIESQPQ
jgi:hypothetical protein